MFQVREEVRPEGVTSKVVIRKVNRKDSSEFQCDASNKFGNSKRRIKLIVQVILILRNVKIGKRYRKL